MIKRVNLYISARYEQIVIAPLYQNEDGTIYEQDSCSSLPYPVSPELLGNEVMNSFNLFYLDQKHPGNISGLSVLNSYRAFYVGDPKRAGLASYKVSKVDTVEDFEEAYMYISISGASDSNETIVIEGSPSRSNDLWIKSSIPIYAHRKELGDMILRVYDACVSGNLR